MISIQHRTGVLHQFPQCHEAAVNAFNLTRSLQPAMRFVKEPVVPLHPVAGFTLLHHLQARLLRTGVWLILRHAVTTVLVKHTRSATTAASLMYSLGSRSPNQMLSIN